MITASPERRAISIETLSLDETARVHEAFLRTVRVLRACVGSLTGTALLLPIVWLLYLPLMLAPRAGETTGPLLPKLVFLCLLLGGLVAFVVLAGYLFFYVFRIVASASLRAAHIVLAVLVVMIVMIALSLAARLLPMSPSVPSDISHQTDPWHALPLLWAVPYLLVGGVVWLTPLCLAALGLARIVRYQRSPLFPLLVDRNCGRGFWAGWGALLGDFQVLTGITVPLRLVRGRGRILSAAVGTFALEGTAYYWYFDLGSDLVEAPEKLLPHLPPAIALALPLSVAMVAFPLVLAIFALSRRLRRYAQRRALLSADEMRLVDPRRPVLFLRSFHDDQVSLADARMAWPLRLFDLGAQAGTLEELLIREFAYLGPVLAIGNPSDQLPALGAARKYCRGKSWQEVVEALIDEAALIVVAVEQSAGVGWETETVRRKKLLGKALFILPPDHAASQTALVQLLLLLGFVVEPSDLVPSAATLAVLFPAPGNVRLLRSTRVTELEYQLAVRATRLASWRLSPC